MGNCLHSLGWWLQQVSRMFQCMVWMSVIKQYHAVVIVVRCFSSIILVCDSFHQNFDLQLGILSFLRKLKEQSKCSFNKTYCIWLDLHEWNKHCFVSLFQLVCFVNPSLTRPIAAMTVQTLTTAVLQRTTSLKGEWIKMSWTISCHCVWLIIYI